MTFHALHDKVHRRDVLERAWRQVRANRGAAGIDRQTIEQVERYGVARLLDELAADLRTPTPPRRPCQRLASQTHVNSQLDSPHLAPAAESRAHSEHDGLGELVVPTPSLVDG